MKNAFDGLITSLHTAEERIFELEDTSVQTSKSEKRREKGQGKKKKKRHRMSKVCAENQKEKKERNREMFKTTVTENVPH